MYMLSRMATRLRSKEAGIIAAIIAAFSSPLLMQLQPMRIDHHGCRWRWRFWRCRRCSGLGTQGRRRAGHGACRLLHISLRGAPISAAFFLCLGWRWIADPVEGQRLHWTIASFAVSSLLLFFATQASGMSAATYCDNDFAATYLGHRFGCGHHAAPIHLFGDKSWLRIAAIGGAAGGVLAIMMWMAPTCLKRRFRHPRPGGPDYWYANVTEGLPVWRQDWRTAIFLLADRWSASPVALCCCAAPGVSQREKLILIGFFVAYCCILSLLVFRTVSVATACAIPVTAALIAKLFDAYRQSKVPTRRVALVVAMLFLLVPGALLSSVLRLAPAWTSQPWRGRTRRTSYASRPRSVAALKSVERGNFLAPFDMGPTILAQTPHSVLASSHHRNVAGMRDHIEIFRSPPDKAHRLMRARNIDYLAACPHEAELRFYARKDPDGLWAQIARGNVPDWLKPMPDMGKGMKIWRVR